MIHGDGNNSFIPVEDALKMPQKALGLWRDNLNDLWNICGLSQNGQSWITSHYGFAMTAWHLPFALSVRILAPATPSKAARAAQPAFNKKERATFLNLFPFFEAAQIFVGGGNSPICPNPQLRPVHHAVQIQGQDANLPKASLSFRPKINQNKAVAWSLPFFLPGVRI